MSGNCVDVKIFRHFAPYMHPIARICKVEINYYF